MLLNNFKTKLNFLSKFGLNKFFHGLNPAMRKNFLSCNFLNTNYQLDSFLENQISKQSFESTSIITNENFEAEDKIMKNNIPTAEFLNKTSKLAIRKRRKRKYGKKTSLRYR